MTIRTLMLLILAYALYLAWERAQFLAWSRSNNTTCGIHHILEKYGPTPCPESEP